MNKNLNTIIVAPMTTNKVEKISDTPIQVKHNHKNPEWYGYRSNSNVTHKSRVIKKFIINYRNLKLKTRLKMLFRKYFCRLKIKLQLHINRLFFHLTFFIFGIQVG